MNEKYGVGTLHKTNNGTFCEVIEKINSEARKVKFLEDDNIIICNRNSLRLECLENPNTSNKKYGVGTIHRTNEGYDIQIVKIINREYRLIKFIDDYKFELKVAHSNIRNGEIRNPFHKSICGVGYLGENFRVANEKAYISWQHMVRRCYDKKNICKHPTYNGIKVCDEWHNYSNFEKWYLENYPNDIKDIKFQIDKDLLQENVENKIYSPNTCVFLPHSVNSFISNKRLNNTSGFTGVYYCNKTKKWKAQINIFRESGIKSLGYFLSPEEASQSYKKARSIESEKVKKYLKTLNYLSEDVIQLVK